MRCKKYPRASVRSVARECGARPPSNARVSNDKTASENERYIFFIGGFRARTDEGECYYQYATIRGDGDRGDAMRARA